MRMLIAGGGTGGHIYPGIALAQELMTRQKDNEVLFVGTARGLETTLIPGAGYPLRTIEVVGLKGKGVLGALRGLFKIPVALWQSARIVREFKPHVALGVGGYVSGPVILAAALLGVPTGIQEQNAYPGLANRILSRFVRVVFVSFEAAARHFSPRKVKVLGNPIRRGFLDNFIQPDLDPGEKRGFTLFFMGGSQGAHHVNLLALEAVDALRQDIPDLRVIHQTGRKDEELVR
jgi:UDP-N-acetylglucosamine--N-acetylmuramyl-(pentapeptide) pyrophosphoryl-undecaprenol N-acetylglucosamine transferase